MAAVMTTGISLPPDWLIMKKVAIPAEIAIITTFMKQGPDQEQSEQSYTQCHTYEKFMSKNKNVLQVI